MLKIGICDDCRGQIELIKSCIEGSRGGLSHSVFSSIEPERFLMKAMEIKPQLVFLGIDLAEMSGIELGERIKAYNVETLLIYITEQEKHLYDPAETGAFQYLTKPITPVVFEQAFNAALNELERMESQKLK